METERELNAKIIAITMQIQEKHPELSKFLNEMPITIPNENKPEINLKILKEYYDSLSNLLNDYLFEHSLGISQSHPRPDANRLLDGSILNFDLPSAIERIKQEGEWISGKHNAITLMKSERMRILLIAMRKENEMKMHQLEGAISIYIIEGKTKFITENESKTLLKNQLVTLHEKIKHGFIAIEETILLLTMVHEKRI